MTIYRLGFILTALAASAALASLSPAQQTSHAPQLLQSMDVPLPPGPFASWPAASREPALRGLRSRCMFMTGMAFDNYRGPKDALGPEGGAVMSACIAKMMPEDWPGQTAAREQSSSLYQAARRLDPKIPDADKLADMIVKAMKDHRR